MDKLKRMLKYVSEHNEFYKNRIKEYGITNPLDITQWPVLTRKELQENRYNMFSDGYQAKYFGQQLRRQSSSGSSGVPVNVYWDYKDWYASNLCLWRKRLKWYGIRPSDRYVVFTLNALDYKGTEEDVLFLTSPDNVLSINLSLVRNESQYKQMAEVIEKFNPVWMQIQPFILNKLIQIYKKYAVQKPEALQYLESVGEILPSDLKRRALEYLEVPIANMYGSEEMNGIAFESPVGDMCVLTDNVLLEVRNTQGVCSTGKGESIITNLNNYAMPLIRYCQGDVIEVTEKDSAKGAVTVKDIHGRKLQEVEINGRYLNAFAFSEVVSTVNNRLDDVILEYQFVYSKEQEKLYCNVVLEDSRQAWLKSTENALKSCAEETLLIPKEMVEVVSLKTIEKKGRKHAILQEEETNGNI